LHPLVLAVRQRRIMPYVLTLVANRAAAELTAATIARLRDAVSGR
jgi:hypothetical protein